MDQYRLPQGSLFLELYNLRTTGSADNGELPSVPTSLYVEQNGKMKLDLAKLSPADPVWGAQQYGESGCRGPMMPTIVPTIGYRRIQPTPPA